MIVSGANSGDVAPVLSGGGSINVENNGAHVAATQTGTGSITIVNNGQVMAATNTGSGAMWINSDATGAVAVTRNGNGDTSVSATGSGAIAYTINGDGDVTYPNQLPSRYIQRNQLRKAALDTAPIQVSGSNAAGVTTTLTGSGSLHIVNNGGAVTVT